MKEIIRQGQAVKEYSNRYTVNDYTLQSLILPNGAEVSKNTDVLEKEDFKNVKIGEDKYLFAKFNYLHGKYDKAVFEKYAGAPTTSLISNIAYSDGTIPDFTYNKNSILPLKKKAHIPQKEKESFSARLKAIWLAPEISSARRRADEIVAEYGKRFPKAITILEEGLEDSLSFYAFPKLDSRKIASTNMLERLNKEIRRRTRVIGIFPNPNSYLRLVVTYLIEYAEDWSVSKAYIAEDTITQTLKLAA